MAQEPEATRPVEVGETVSAFPNKDFFVSMLTRDIELQDAILDLLDNCIDGVVRTLAGRAAAERPYEGFEAHIEMNPDRFAIRDNCGGIPLQLAREKAFNWAGPRVIATLRRQSACTASA